MAKRVLDNAKKQKVDEFYTRLIDIENEAKHYKEHFKDKTVLCNCDDPRASQFFYFFYSGFKGLGLKRLIATCYKNLNPNLFTQNLDKQAVYCIYDGKDRRDDVFTDYETFIKQNEWNG
ncbi:MAG: adenine-specific methyltransferase EcoRI family protein, partial [Helicobacteraceae bacterium]|nr:adenine-specific methyltransferase EcoRI family protein [Helicobacteraceae bacterium]